MGSCLVARFTYGLRKTHHVTITVVPEKSPVLCFGIGVERCVGVQQPKTALYVDILPLHPVLRLGNEYHLQVKGNQRAYSFVLFWSTQNGARMELQQPDNGDEGEVTPLHGAQFLTTVRKNVSEWKQRVDALHRKQEEVQQGQETILSELRRLNGLVSSLCNDVNEVKRQRTQG